MVARPLDAGRESSPGAVVLVLAVPQSGEREVTVPLKPAAGLNEGAHVGVDVDGPGELLPGAAQVGGLGGEDEAVLDGEAGALVRVLAALGGDGDLLERERHAREDAAPLEHGRAVAEDEVDCAVDVALPVELPQRVRVQRVLVPLEAALEECRLVRVHAHRHRLVLFWPRRVAERHAAAYKPFARHRCHVNSWSIHILLF